MDLGNLYEKRSLKNNIKKPFKFSNAPLNLFTCKLFMFYKHYIHNDYFFRFKQKLKCYL